MARRDGAGAIHLSDDVSGYARRRRERLARACERHGVRLRIYPGVTVVEPGELVPTGRRPLPRLHPLLAGLVRAAAPRPSTRRRASCRCPPASGCGTAAGSRAAHRRAPSPELPRGGEAAARKRLERWLRGGLADYEDGHDELAGDGPRASAPTSTSAASRRPRCCDRVEGRPGAAAFIRQLCWRDFHHQVLAARPDLPRADYRGRGDRWRRSKRLAEAWRRGAPATRSSMPGCASSPARASCTTAPA